MIIEILVVFHLTITSLIFSSYQDSRALLSKSFFSQADTIYTIRQNGKSLNVFTTMPRLQPQTKKIEHKFN